MEQIEFMMASKSANDILPEIISRMQTVLRENWLDESFVGVEERSKSKSILFHGVSLIVRISGKNNPTFVVPTSTLLGTVHYSGLVANPKKDYQEFKITEFESTDQCILVLCECLQVIIDRYPKDYDCCSRYAECSDAKRCIHPDVESALKCGYRKIIKNGRIYYGKNRNV